MTQLPSFDTRPAVVLATHNAAKLAELRTLVSQAELDLDVLGLADLAEAAAPDETGTSFEENALIKAHDAAHRSGLPALADDSGLVVDALNGMPGIRSARWAGAHASDDDNLQLLLRQVDDVPDERRTARFVSAIALVVPTADGTDEHVVTQSWEGRLAHAARGANGFGYDPIFLPDDAPGTSAELTPKQKNVLSHRGKAMREMIEVLKGAIT